MSKLCQGPPPGYLTTEGAVRALGISRQLFHQSLADALDRWQIGPGRGTLLYRADDVTLLCRWLDVRRGLVELGLRPTNYPLAPDDGEFHAAVEEGEWDAICPRCGGEAVGDGGAIWCPACNQSPPAGR